MKNLNTSINANKMIMSTLLVIAIPVAIYFLTFKAFPKLIISEENYGEYYLERAGWLFTHAFFGISATLLGPFQFISRLRNKNLKLHRNLGKVYLVSVLISSLTAVYLAFTSEVSISYAIGLFVLAILWLLSGAMAYQLIRNRQIKKHKEWMIRNYVITFFFILFVSISDAFKLAGVADLQIVLSVLVWASWIVPLSISEYFIQRAR